MERDRLLLEGAFSQEKPTIVDVLWLRYAVETEEYDRTLPGMFFRDSGEWMPFPGEPCARSIEFAREAKSKMREDAARYELPGDFYVEVRRRWERYRHEDLKEILKSLQLDPGEVRRATRDAAA